MKHVLARSAATVAVEAVEVVGAGASTAGEVAAGVNAVAATVVVEVEAGVEAVTAGARFLAEMFYAPRCSAAGSFCIFGWASNPHTTTALGRNATTAACNARG